MRSSVVPTLDLAPADMGELLGILAKHVRDAEVWAYGSRISGTAHAGSDLDLVIRRRTGATGPTVLGELREAFSESDLPMLVDVHDWARIPDSFRREIEQAHVVIQDP